MKIFFKSLFLLFVLGILTGCGGNSATVRFKVIAMLEVDGEVKEFSNVMQVEYTRKERSALGYGGSSKMWGEVMVIDLGNRGRAYMLLSRFASRQYFSVYPSGILRTFEIDASVGSLKSEDIKTLSTLSGRRTLINTNHKGRDVQPSVIAFNDESDPNSIFILSNDEFESHFGPNIKFLNIDVEITKEPVTKGVLIRYLPWLEKKFKAGFERIPPGPERPKLVSDWPLRWFVNYNVFYASESR